MSLTRALTSGISSLQSHQKKMDVVSNNIANVNTVGYKSSRALFSDEFSQIQKFGRSATSERNAGGTNPLQYGLGVQVASVTLDMKQGNLDITDRPLDLALQGDGFFVYNINGKQLYSRAGAISRDTVGNLVDSSTGAFLQGYNVQLDANGNTIKDENGINAINSSLSNITISPSTISSPSQTQNVSLVGNLSSSNAVDSTRETSINIFDNQGGPHSLKLIFTKTANSNEYSLTTEINGTAFGSGTTVTFNSDGTLESPSDITINAADLNGALGTESFDQTAPKNITVKLGEQGNIANSLTNYSGLNTATLSSQDGYEAGTIRDLSVDTDGRIWGAFTNGRSELLGQVVVAKFANSAGLIKDGSNFFSVSPNSGLANIGTAGEIFPSTSIHNNSLEMSNVDLTKQFTDMITTQRGFEAASRVITVSDSMLAEINMLKR